MLDPFFQAPDPIPDEEAIPGRFRDRRHPHPEADLSHHRPPAHLLLLRHHRHGKFQGCQPQELLPVSNF